MKRSHVVRRQAADRNARDVYGVDSPQEGVLGLSLSALLMRSPLNRFRLRGNQSEQREV